MVLPGQPDEANMPIDTDAVVFRTSVADCQVVELRPVLSSSSCLCLWRWRER